MGFFESLINQITAPIGVRLFKGGPYPDKGLGDRQLAQMKKVEDILRYQLPYAQELLGYIPTLISTITGTMPRAQERTPSPSFPTMELSGLEPQILRELTKTIGIEKPSEYPALMGYYASIPSLLHQYAQMAGIGSPFREGGGISQVSPYGLSPIQEAALNQQIDEINRQREASKRRLKSRLIQQGIRGPALESALARIDREMDRMIQNQRTQFMQNALEMRQQALGYMAEALSQLGNLQEAAQGRRISQLGSLAEMGRRQRQDILSGLSQLVGLGQGMLESAAGGMGSTANLLGQMAQRASEQSQQAGAIQAALLGQAIGSGRLFPGVFLPPSAKRSAGFGTLPGIAGPIPEMLTPGGFYPTAFYNPFSFPTQLPK